MKQLAQIFVCSLLLTGCAYRYGAGTFFLGEDVPPQAISAYPMQDNTQDTSVVNRCKEDNEETLEVINKLDATTQTIVTTAKTTRETVHKCEGN